MDMAFRSLSGGWLHKAWFILCFDLALATFQNITVDDSVQIGSTAPAYLPSPTNWNQGNTCTECYVQPNASLAYNGTWHDSTFSPANAVDQEFEFTFVGSALYIFFILANNVPGATTFTHVAFTLDGAQVSTFTHVPSTSSDFEYNQAVYANDSIPFGQHTMLVAPINDSVSNLLMLFDYYIYSTNASDVATTTTTMTSGSVSATAPSSPLSPASATSPNIGAIVGGVVGGLGAIAIVIACLLCYRRQKRRRTRASSEWAIDAPFVQTAQALSETVLPGSRHKGNVPASLPTTVPPSGPSVPTPSSSSANSAAELREQVELLRGEVVRMRQMQNEWSASGVVTEPPPEYSQD